MMKNLKKYRILVVAALLMASAAIATGCSDAKGGKRSDAAEEAHRPDRELKMLMQSISNGDANTFASLCVYPIDRPYPIRAIADSSTMVDYFPILADVTLRDKVGKSKLDDWDYYGWRGWSLGDSTILWFDEGLQFIDYESQAESGLRKILAREEIMSLHPEFRGDWSPVETMVEIEGDRIFRIDADRDGYRLLEYDRPENMRHKPIVVMRGTMKSEGSAGLVTYSFTDSIGNMAEYSPDMEPPVKVIITPLRGSQKEYKVRRSYWRDHLR